jgi:hypothetical protein
MLVQRLRRLLLVFGLMFALPVLGAMINVTNLWLMWLSMAGMLGLITVSVFVVAVASVSAFRRRLW